MIANEERRGWPENAVIGEWNEGDGNFYRFDCGILQYRYATDDGWETSAFQLDEADQDFLDWMDSLLPDTIALPQPTFWSASDMATVKHAISQATSLLDEIARISRSAAVKGVANEAKKVLSDAMEDVST